MRGTSVRSTEHGCTSGAGRAVADKADDAIAELRRIADFGFDQLRLFAVADDQHPLEVAPVAVSITQQSASSTTRLSQTSTIDSNAQYTSMSRGGSRAR